MIAESVADVAKCCSIRDKRSDELKEQEAENRMRLNRLAKGSKDSDENGPIGLGIHDGREASAMSLRKGSTTAHPVAVSNLEVEIEASLQQYAAILLAISIR